MIELTEEMHSAFWDASVKQARKVANAKRPADLEGSICRAGLAAVLAIVERDQAGRCSATLPRLARRGLPGAVEEENA